MIVGVFGNAQEMWEVVGNPRDFVHTNTITCKGMSIAERQNSKELLLFLLIRSLLNSIQVILIHTFSANARQLEKKKLYLIGSQGKGLYDPVVSSGSKPSHGETEAALHRCSYKKVFWKCAANLQENTHAEMWFNKVAKQHIEHRISGTAFAVLERSVRNFYN